MSPRHVIIFFAVASILLDPIETAKAKKTKSSKNKSPKQSPKPVAKKAPYIPSPDKSYFPPGGRVWNWDELRDSPFNNVDFQEIWTYLRETTVAQGTPMYSPLYFNTMKRILDNGIRVAYVLANKKTRISTMYVAHVQTENGTNIPPILGAGCTLDHCTDPYLSFDWVSQIETQDLIDIDKPSEIEQTYDDFIAQWFRLSRSLSQESAKATICNGPIIGPTKRTVDVRLGSLQEEYRKFLDDPGNASPERAKNMLIKAASGTSGKLLLALMENLCKGVV